MTDERIRQIAKPVADRHAARHGIPLSGFLYDSLLWDLVEAIKKALAEERDKDKDTA